MATFRIPILGSSTKPESPVYPQPTSVNGTNNFFKPLIFIFPDSGTKDEIHGIFQVPQNYVGSPKAIVPWSSTATSGNIVFDFDYRAVAAGESMDQATAQESVTVTDAAPSSTDELQIAEMSLTAGNLSAGDMVPFILYRDGANASDTLTADGSLYGVYFEYTDA